MCEVKRRHYNSAFAATIIHLTLRAISSLSPEQSKRFLEAAKEHGAATTEEEATRAFRKVVGKPKAKAR